jgi:hypothetical protein
MHTKGGRGRDRCNSLYHYIFTFFNHLCINKQLSKIKQRPWHLSGPFHMEGKMMWIVFIKYALIPFILFCAALALYEWIDEKYIYRRKRK